MQIPEPQPDVHPEIDIAELDHDPLPRTRLWPGRLQAWARAQVL